jgi:hypothetical protein
MYNEVAIATKMMLLMDRLTADQLGGKAPIREHRSVRLTGSRPAGRKQARPEK